MLYRDDPYRRAKVGDLAYTFESFLGPVYSATAGNIDRASRFLEEGRSFDAIQATLPSFVRNGLKSYDLAMNGALNSKGYPLIVEKFEQDGGPQKVAKSGKKGACGHLATIQ